MLAPVDRDLQAFLAADDPGAAADALGRVLAGGLLTLISQVVSRELGRSPRMAGAIDDVVADVRLKLVERLQAWRSGEDDPIDNLPAYARTLSLHAAYAVLRREFPERTRLRNRIRYVLTHHPDLELAPGVDDAPVCRVRGPRRMSAAGSTRGWMDDPVAAADRAGLTPALPLPRLILGILERCDAPLPLDALVEIVSRLAGIADAPRPASRPDAAPLDVPDRSPGALERLVQHETLATAWRELVQLPPFQRAALLLNLRDTDGGALIQTLPATGIAARDAIAAALDMSVAQLDRLWPDLPLDDLAIAARLGLTRQQVINLRKSGRARLARRLAGNMTPPPSSTSSKGT